MGAEQVVENKCVLIAQKRGWVARKMSYLGRRGCRDRDFYKDGCLLMVEFKAPGEGLRPDQKKEKKVLKAVGFDVHVIDNVEDFCELLDRTEALASPSKDF